MPSRHVFVVGNAAVDETIVVEDFPVAGSSIHGQVIGQDLGGKGLNQAVVIARCGVPTTLVAAIGNDARADIIRDGLADEPLQCVFLSTAYPTDSSIILRDRLGDNANITTTASANCLDAQAVFSALSSATPADVLIIQGNLSSEAARACLERAKSIGMTAVANPSPYREYFASLWSFIDTVFVNESEAKLLSDDGQRFDPDFCWSKGMKAVVRSLGEKGAELHRPATSFFIPAIKVPVQDTTGAGDVFLAASLSSALNRNGMIDDIAIGHGVRAASIAVAREGTFRALPTREELRSVLVLPRPEL
ncbi:ribokinase [Allorhizobium sonneratiae]|uniref:ribokinase n=1 Tax=Allorhizobium sonneratiae TaxID=2934936 RepID=UPI003084256B